jgi:hypothetical protein
MLKQVNLRYLSMSAIHITLGQSKNLTQIVSWKPTDNKTKLEPAFYTKAYVCRYNLERKKWSLYLILKPTYEALI